MKHIKLFEGFIQENKFTDAPATPATPAKPGKAFIVKVTYDKGQGRTRVKYVKGTVEDMIGYFGYTLEIGHSHKRSINMNPKTPKAFIKALSDSYSEKEAALYNRTMVDLVEEIPADVEPGDISDQTKKS